MVGVFVGFSRMFLLGILIFKWLTARRLYKSFGVKGLRGLMSDRLVGKRSSFSGLPVTDRKSITNLHNRR
jgi:hypothetical protein